ncbi:MAG: hypothetical protein ABSE93_00250 [Terriglobia bacterium]
MPEWKELHFKIEGKINGVDLTPFTMPMARLALYLNDLAQLFGYRESVHLIAVAEGSTAPVIYIDPAEETRITYRVRHAQRGMGPIDANRAYKKLDNKLREDTASATIINVSQKAEVIEFPGIKANLPQAYGPIKERASVVGELKRVGGFDPTIPIHLQRVDGAIFYCDADAGIAKQLAPFYCRIIRVHGLATYSRGKEGQWRIDHFKIQSFDPEPLSDERFSATIEKLKGIEGSEWPSIPDPLEELRKIRHGE